MDVLLAAIDTTSKAASLIFYPIAVHSEVQEKLRKEIMDLPDEILDGRVSMYRLMCDQEQAEPIWARDIREIILI